MRSADNAVSESIGYVLLFGIVLSGSALVGLYGYPLIQEKKVELIMEILIEELTRVTIDMNDMTETRKPVAYEEFQVEEGSLFLEDAGADMGTFFLWQGGRIIFSYHPGSLHYVSNTEGNELIIENGACIKKVPDESFTMISRPGAYYDKTKKALVLPFIRLLSADMRTTSGHGRIILRMNGSPYMYEFSNIPEKVAISYSGPQEHDTSLAWKDYFQYSLRMKEYPRGYAKEEAEKVIVLLYTLTVSRG